MHPARPANAVSGRGAYLGAVTNRNHWRRPTMNISFRTAARWTTFGGALLISATLAAAPRSKDGIEAVTAEGLQRVDDTPLDAAWVKPGLDLRSYDKLVLQPVGISFRAVEDRGLRRDVTDFALDDEQKQKVEQTIWEALAEEIGKSERFEITDQAGPGVLIATGALLDVVSHVPPDPIGRGATFVRSLGEATLVIELRDSVTGELFARAVDRRAAEPVFPTRTNAVNNPAEVRRAARRWASVLRARLDELAS
jgi:hypothetical protein